MKKLPSETAAHAPRALPRQDRQPAGIEPAASCTPFLAADAAGSPLVGCYLGAERRAAPQERKRDGFWAIPLSLCPEARPCRFIPGLIRELHAYSGFSIRRCPCAQLLVA